jgi:hypothetical protein
MIKAQFKFQILKCLLELRLWFKLLQGAYLPQLDETLKLGDMEVTAERHYSLKNCQVIKYFISQVLFFCWVVKIYGKHFIENLECHPAEHGERRLPLRVAV